MSVVASIYLYLIELLFDGSPSGNEYYHIELPFVSSKETVLFPSYHENAYNNDSVLPNTSPRCPKLMLLLPNVYFIQTAAFENVRGLNLNKCCPIRNEVV
jgi:hypothetical protein